jgi:hypothetical protein
MLAALAITAALVAVVMPFAGRLVERWSHGEQAVQDADAWMQATQRLAADLSEAIPLHEATTDRALRVLFRMDRRSVVLVRPALAQAASPLELTAYVIEPNQASGDALVRYSAPFEQGRFDTDPRGYGNATTLLSGPFRLAFRAVSTEMSRSEDWMDSAELPLSLELVAAPTVRGFIPAVTALPIAASTPPAPAGREAGPNSPQQPR